MPSVEDASPPRAGDGPEPTEGIVVGWAAARYRWLMVILDAYAGDGPWIVYSPHLDMVYQHLRLALLFDLCNAEYFPAVRYDQVDELLPSSLGEFHEAAVLGVWRDGLHAQAIAMHGRFLAACTHAGLWPEDVEQIFADLGADGEGEGYAAAVARYAAGKSALLACRGGAGALDMWGAEPAVDGSSDGRLGMASGKPVRTIGGSQGHLYAEAYPPSAKRRARWGRILGLLADDPNMTVEEIRCATGVRSKSTIEKDLGDMRKLGIDPRTRAEFTEIYGP